MCGYDGRWQRRRNELRRPSDEGRTAQRQRDREYQSGNPRHASCRMPDARDALGAQRRKCEKQGEHDRVGYPRKHVVLPYLD